MVDPAPGFLGLSLDGIWIVIAATSKTGKPLSCCSTYGVGNTNERLDNAELSDDTAKRHFNRLWRLLALLCMRLTYQTLARTTSEICNPCWRRACINVTVIPIMPNSLELVPVAGLTSDKTCGQNISGLRLFQFEGVAGSSSDQAKHDRYTRVRSRYH